jgi:hypothetical protein
MDDVKIINNFVSEEDINFLIKYIDENWEDQTKFRHRVGLANNKGIAVRAIFPDEKPASLFKDLQTVIDKYSKMFIDSSKNEFSDGREVYFYGVSITRLSKDIQIRLHSDVHEEFSDLVYSGVMYLNDDYEGGEIAFVDKYVATENDLRMDHSKSAMVSFPLYDDSMGGIVYKPKAGDMVIFPSDKPHGGKVVTEGTRDAIVFWSTLSKEYAFEGFDSDRILEKIRN